MKFLRREIGVLQSLCHHGFKKQFFWFPGSNVLCSFSCVFILMHLSTLENLTSMLTILIHPLFLGCAMYKYGSIWSILIHNFYEKMAYFSLLLISDFLKLSLLMNAFYGHPFEIFVILLLKLTNSIEFRYKSKDIWRIVHSL